MKYLKKIILFFVFFCYCTHFNAAPVIIYNSGDFKTIGKQVYVLEDTTKTLKFGDIIKSKNFNPSKTPIINLKVSKSTFWITFAIKNNSINNDLVIEVSEPNISKISFYTISNNELITMSEEGNSFVYSKRQYDHQNFIFDLNLKKDETKQYYLKVESTSQIILPLIVGQRKKILESLLQKDFVFGIFFGIMMIMFFYNLFIYFTVKEPVYLYYVCYILMLAFSQATLNGYSFKYFWPNSIWLSENAIFIFTNLGGLAALLFTRHFLQTKLYTPLLNKLLNIIILLFIISIVIAFTNKKNLSFILMQNVTLIGSVYAITLGFITLKKGYKPAKFFLLSWFIFLSGVTVFILKDYGIFPVNNFTTNTLIFGSATEIVLLSFALADKINTYKKEKEISQAEALRVSQENETLIREQNVVLEKKVTERTEELRTANNQLNKTLVDLKDAQAQLVDAEKMASLGQLTAGIAHEINNPINFVKSNVKPLQLDINDLFELIAKYQKLHKVPVGAEDSILKEIRSFEREIDPDYIKEEVKTLISGIEEGAQRTAEIVQGLRNFSRLDESELKTINIYEGIESTLLLLKNALPPYIKIIKHFDAPPDVECYPSKLNQVFMNILTNGIQAINSKAQKSDESITISVKKINDMFLEISIKDSGIGMSEEVQHRVFEPFFTTKDVGEGTGLGMSIVFKIIEKHNAKIKIVSAVGKGAEFIITLPYTQPVS